MGIAEMEVLGMVNWNLFILFIFQPDCFTYDSLQFEMVHSSTTTIYSTYSLKLGYLWIGNAGHKPLFVREIVRRHRSVRGDHFIQYLETTIVCGF